MNIDFALIDIRADGLMLAIDADNPNNLHNAEVLGEAQAEYLNELLALQQRIKKKYEPRLVPNKQVEGQDPDNVLDRLEGTYRQLRNEGVKKLYYT